MGARRGGEGDEGGVQEGAGEDPGGEGGRDLHQHPLRGLRGRGEEGAQAYLRGDQALNKSNRLLHITRFGAHQSSNNSSIRLSMLNYIFPKSTSHCHLSIHPSILSSNQSSIHPIPQTEVENPSAQINILLYC